MRQYSEGSDHVIIDKSSDMGQIFMAHDKKYSSGEICVQQPVYSISQILIIT